MKPSDVAELKTIFHKHVWVIEEMIMDFKMQEVNRLVSGNANGMFTYLRDQLGSGESVLGTARDLIIRQRARRKTIGTFMDDTPANKKKGR